MNRTRSKMLRYRARELAPTEESIEPIYQALKKAYREGGAPPFKGHMTLSRIPSTRRERPWVRRAFR